MTGGARERLERWFRAGLAAADARDATLRALSTAPPPARDPVVLAFGKAAPGMATATVEWLRTHGLAPLDGIQVSQSDDPSAASTIVAMRGDHPVPGNGSERACLAIAALVDRLPHGVPVIVLISGGTSSLIAGPADGVTMAAVRQGFTVLHRLGTSIHEMNRRRRELTRWSGGRLAHALSGHPVRAWVISDVLDNDLATIGSGPLLDPAHPGAVPHVLVADGAMAAEAAGAAARDDGFRVFVHSHPLDDDVRSVATTILAASSDRPGVHVFRGEPTVTLPESPGKGGRAQHLALLLAEQLHGSALRTTILAAGTDGRDGITDAAGAIIDGSSAAAMLAAGIDLHRTIAAADSHPALDAIGALLRTGPTGTNVADLVIALVE